MDARIKKLIDDGTKLFTDRQSAGILSLWQETAENFYPERADFTLTMNSGADFASHLTTSYPLIARRTLGDAFGSMLRPVNTESLSKGVWFSLRAKREEQETDNTAKAWLEWATGVQYRAMYDKDSQFTRATKEGDHDFATFGQCVLSLELNRNNPKGPSLLYRCWHIRDVVWAENHAGRINEKHRVWKPTLRQAMKTFGAKCHQNIQTKVKESPHERVEFRHVVLDAEDYQDGKKWRAPYVSVWFDVTNGGHVMEEIASHSRVYIIPRWRTIPQCQYSHSPAAIVALPDARLIQAMTLTLLDAGEKFANPPLVATQEAVRSDINHYPGGLTWVDAEYDEKLGEALRPLYQPNAGQGLNTALELAAMVREQINKAFFLDSLSLPPAAQGDKMTATEVGMRVSEWIRRALPLFEPMEMDYNGQLCEETFDLLMRNGAFGSVKDIPQSLRGQDLEFRFESPIHEAADRKAGQKLLEVVALTSNVATLDPSVAQIPDFKTAFRDALTGIGSPAKWQRSEEQVAQIEQAQAEAEATAAALATIEPAAKAAADLGSASKSFSEAAAIPAPV